MVSRYSLNGEWELASVKGRHRKWMPAEVPGCLHTDLMSNGVISDPFYRFNEHDAMVHERSDWKYRRRFHLSDAQYNAMMRRRVRLVCDGLDTFATIKLNGNLVGKAGNMFVGHEFDIKKLLKKGRNELLIIFESAVRVGSRLRAKHGRSSGGHGFEIRSYVRKAQYSFGWDWGPELPTMGIWKDIYIESYDEKIRDVCFRVLEADAGEAEVKVLVDIDVGRGRKLDCEISLDGRTSTISRKSKSTSETISERFVIRKPRLWWPNGYGKPNLYPLKVKLLSNGKAVDSKELDVGIRTVELVQEKDAEGRNFLFKVNGVPVYCRGANFIPTDNFLHRTTDEKYSQLLQMAADANMNMLRIWGGGIYENDVFYSLCDRLGLMVWQDFMFACAMYPHTKFFLKNVDMEARKVVTRLRNRPCVTIWCGENEDHIWYGEHETQVHRRRTHTWWDDPKFVWGQKIYHEILLEICEELDPTRPYTPGSPVGAGPNGELNANSMTEGDRHAWDVWSGWADYHDYRKDTGRFQSEFGFQAPPNLSTIRKYALPEDLHPQSRWMEHHNKQGGGNERLYRYLSEHHVVPTDLDEFIFLCQVNQGEALKTGVEHFRRRKFKTAGALIWQMNDCWPVTSWSMVDCESRPKLSYYFARRFFAPVLLSIVETRAGIEVWLTNDTMHTVKGSLNVRSFAFTGRKIRSQSLDVRVPKNSSRRCLVTSRSRMKIDHVERHFINARLVRDGKVVAENNLIFDKTKHLDLPTPRIDTSVEQISEKEFRITLRSKAFVRGCTLSFRGGSVELSDNCFDLVPGDEKAVLCVSAKKTTPKSLSIRMKVRWVRSLKTDLP